MGLREDGADGVGGVAGAVLVVDDDATIRNLYRAALARAGHEVFLANDAAQARQLVEGTDGLGLDAVVLDIMMPGESGLELLVSLQKARPNLPVVLSTSVDQARDAVQAMRNGAFDYLVKPTPIADLLLVVRNAVEKSRMARELSARRTLEEGVVRGAHGAVFHGVEMRRIMSLLNMVKDASVPVMLLGETGTGKEVVARTLHAHGRRAARPFVAVNCASLPHDLAESELFGHERGAFTGAAARRVGRFEEADGGTLFLDEVGELPLALQAKLLRVLQESEVTRVGGTGCIKVDVRVVVATHRDIRGMIKAGTFREDLFYRLNVISLALPPLRKRKDEIPALSDVLLARFAESERVPARSLSQDAVAQLQAYDWPGNVRELENTLKRSALLSSTPVLTAADLQWEHGAAPHSPGPLSVEVQRERGDEAVPAGAPDMDGSQAPPALGNREAGQEMMMRALAETHGNVTEAAKLLGIGRATFYRWAQRYRLQT